MQKHVFHQSHFHFFLCASYATTCPLSTQMFLPKTFFCRSVPIINRNLCRSMIGVTGNNRNQTTEKMSSARAHTYLMDTLLYKLYVGKSKNANYGMHVFSFSHELFKIVESSHVCFVEHLTTSFCGFTTHLQCHMSGMFLAILIVLSV